MANDETIRNKNKSKKDPLIHSPHDPYQDAHKDAYMGEIPPPEAPRADDPRHHDPAHPPRDPSHPIRSNDPGHQALADSPSPDPDHPEYTVDQVLAHAINAATMVAGERRVPLLTVRQNLDALFSHVQNLRQQASSGPGDPFPLPPDARYQDGHMRCIKCGRVAEATDAQYYGEEPFTCPYPGCGHTVQHDFRAEPNPTLPQA